VTDSVPSCPTLSILAFQLLDHWGNRTTPRPAPRADVLTAALAHGELATRSLAPALPAVAWAQRRSRYAALLLADHLGLADTGAELRGALAGEPTLRQIVTGAQHRINLASLETVSKLAAALLDATPTGGHARLGEYELRWVDEDVIRLHPWPFSGSRLTVRADVPAGGRRTWRLLALGAPRP
jgi:hypothetical protein